MLFDHRYLARVERQALKDRQLLVAIIERLATAARRIRRAWQRRRHGRASDAAIQRP